MVFDWELIGLDPKKHRRVVVAMSGGVDSSVAAVALHKQGFDVIGVTLRLYDAPRSSRAKACCAGVDIYDAAKVAQDYGFPHYVFDYVDKFKKEVIDDFVDTYLSGETPIPCVRCNQSVKFRDLLGVAKDLSADALVTGHYMQRVVSSQGEVQAFKALDAAKDQSYFLFATTKEQLEFLRFPLGGLCKTQIRKLAQEYKLSVATKPDSQDICFVGGRKYSEVIEKLRPDACKPGLVFCVESGRPIGEHGGVHKYTVGQRRGVGVSAENPLYVVRVDAAKNALYVGARTLLEKKYILLKEVNWLGDSAEEGEFVFKLRSSQAPVHGFMRFISGGISAIVCLSKGEISVSAGQVCAAYKGERLMGGGWIQDSCSERDSDKDWLKGYFSQ